MQEKNGPFEWKETPKRCRRCRCKWIVANDSKICRKSLVDVLSANENCREYIRAYDENAPVRKKVATQRLPPTLRTSDKLSQESTRETQILKKTDRFDWSQSTMIHVLRSIDFFLDELQFDAPFLIWKIVFKTSEHFTFSQRANYIVSNSE